MQKQQILDRTFMVSLAGSQAYGTSNPDSDYDYKGVFLAPLAYYYGTQRVEQSQDFTGLATSFAPVELSKDTELFELRRFFELAKKNNPSILDVLYSPVTFVKDDWVKLLLDNRDLFLSRLCYGAFSGYAKQQLHKIEMHRKWLLEPPTAAPTKAEYHVPETMELTKAEFYPFMETIYFMAKEQLSYCVNEELLTEAFRTLLDESVDLKAACRTKLFPEAVLEYTAEMTCLPRQYAQLLQNYKAYMNATEKWQAYQSWKVNRNTKRAETEKKAGYDTKHAMHCLRLLRMGCEILEGNGVLVDRREVGDAEFLKAVRFGEFSYKELMQQVDTVTARLELAKTKTKLPKTPPHEDVEALCVELVKLGQKKFT